MKKTECFLFFTIILLASCGASSESVRLPNNFSSDKIISKQNQLQNILTKEMVAAAVGVPVDKIDEHIESNIMQPGQYTLLYSWPTGKMKKIADGKHEMAAYHSISLGFVRLMTTQAFEQYYGTNDGLQQQVNQISQQENFNKEVGTAEAKYLAAYAEKRKTQKLVQVASMAFWETPMNTLHVLAKDAAFTITANVGDDEALALETAVAVTNAILNP